MKKFLVVLESLSVFCFIGSDKSEAQDTLWTKTYGGTDDDFGHSVQECSGGGFMIAGETGSFGAGYSDVYLIRTDANGDMIWAAS